jgi:ABC-type amino acid transport substrate-binding protein
MFIVNRLNNGLKEIGKSGEYEKIHNKWFKKK